MPDDNVVRSDVVTGVANFPDKISWLRALYLFALIAQDPAVMEKLTSASSESPFDFIKRGVIHDSDIQKFEDFEKRINEEFEKLKTQKEFTRMLSPFIEEDKCK